MRLRLFAIPPGGLAFALEFVDVVRLVVEHHQLGQFGQVAQHTLPRAQRRSSTSSAVAGGAARRQRQHRVHHLLGWQRCGQAR